MRFEATFPAALEIKHKNKRSVQCSLSMQTKERYKSKQQKRRRTGFFVRGISLAATFQ